VSRLSLGWIYNTESVEYIIIDGIIFYLPWLVNLVVIDFTSVTFSDVYMFIKVTETTSLGVVVIMVNSDLFYVRREMRWYIVVRIQPIDYQSRRPSSDICVIHIEVY